ncbi:virulence factor MviM [[Pantoea] beijingensis]|uniref:Virulence factor MviM n=1 Tax=[Pantoea] beijingensis TaxID=1324864 RepID=A0A443ICT8_9GAMM|nr:MULTISPECIES: Gfo/Idh/MocA family oxidoreductase [Erwiniaceae]RWR01934.1 virulence factor MviM [[Pantoea] beijingensis]
MSLLRVGIVGLGGIAQKAWLPVVSQTDGWVLAGAFSPNQQKARQICDSYRMPCFASLDELAAHSDAVFVHSSTSTHFAVVSQLLRAGIDVCVDKPLAGTLREAEQLVELAEKRGRKLMVGFNRRFVPRYLQLKMQLTPAASIRMDKHRNNSVGPNDLRFTLLDDYLHVIDTVLWLAEGRSMLHNGILQTNERGEMVYAEHHFSVGDTQITTSMHRRAGTQRESVLAVYDGGVIQVNDMRDWQQEGDGKRVIDPVAGWESTLTQRGFTGAAHHFIACAKNQTQPYVSGEQALMAQRVVEKIWREADRE